MRPTTYDRQGERVVRAGAPLCRRASWDGTQEWELVVAVPVLSEDGITRPNRAPLLPVPGAVLVVSAGATSVGGPV